MIGIPYVQP